MVLGCVGLVILGGGTVEATRCNPLRLRPDVADTAAGDEWGKKACACGVLLCQSSTTTASCDADPATRGPIWAPVSSVRDGAQEVATYKGVDAPYAHKAGGKQHPYRTDRRVKWHRGP